MTLRWLKPDGASIKVAVALCVGLCGLLAPGLAHAEGEAKQPDAAQAKPQRRSDFMLGASGGLGFGRANGYPNEVQKIGDKDYRQNTKLALGSGELVWLGVAFNDYLSFGFAVGGFNLSGNGRDAKAGLYGFHVDAYPLFDIHKNLQDLGVFGNFGTGPLTITGGAEDADGGLLSYLEAGIVYERLRLWQFGIGPSISLLHMWSESASVTGGLLGARVAFYSGP